MNYQPQLVRLPGFLNHQQKLLHLYTSHVFFFRKSIGITLKMPQTQQNRIKHWHPLDAFVPRVRSFVTHFPIQQR